jgi:hypothetical protein
MTLLIVDQRPSQIYDEVMSQLGTRISGWLGDDLDIQAVLSGLSGRDALRGTVKTTVARLQPKEEVLLLGWALPARRGHAGMMMPFGRSCLEGERRSPRHKI